VAPSHLKSVVGRVCGLNIVAENSPRQPALAVKPEARQLDIKFDAVRPIEGIGAIGPDWNLVRRSRGDPLAFRKRPALRVPVRPYAPIRTKVDDEGASE
jgi:hypothetical protein